MPSHTCMCSCFCRTIVAIAGYTYLDFATTILTFFLVNVLWFLSAYIMTKVHIYSIYMYIQLHVFLLLLEETKRHSSHERESAHVCTA